MILVDYSQLAIANIMQQIRYDKLDEQLVRHMILNSIRLQKQQFHDKFGEIVICVDSRNPWRRDVFPNYKAHRKITQKKSDVDWNSVYDILNIVREELENFMPYKVVKLLRAEADDIIAVISKHSYENVDFGKVEPILILSGDKDFAQLQKFPNVSQYSPITKKYIKQENPAKFVKEHIFLGDSVDGIPNFMSPDDVFITKEKRQTPILRKKLAGWLDQDLRDFCTEGMLRGYKRNEQLIDFEFIPDSMSKNIIEEFEKQTSGDRSKMLNYFMKKRLKNLMEHLNEF